MNPFIVANPFRTSSDCHARALQQLGMLERYLVGRRRLPTGIDPSRSERLAYFYVPEGITSKLFRSSYLTETVRFASSPIFDAWVRRRLLPDCHILAGFGYINRSLNWIQAHGGKVFLEARNSHPESFWSIVADEYARWGVTTPPLPPFHHRRQMKSLELADFVFVPGRFVADSFISRGFPADRLLRTPIPVDTTLFCPPSTIHPNKSFTIVSTGQLSLRKGSPYLLDGFAQFNRAVPSSRLLLISTMANNMKALFHHRYAGLPQVELKPPMPHPELVALLQQADLFVLPSLEEGMLLAAAEAMAVGTPVVLTPNMGTADFVVENANGSIVPIRNAEAIGERMAYWHAKWERDPVAYRRDVLPYLPDFSPATFSETLKMRLEQIGMMR